MLKLFRKEVEEDLPANNENESGTVKLFFFIDEVTCNLHVSTGGSVVEQKRSPNF